MHEWQVDVCLEETRSSHVLHVREKLCGVKRGVRRERGKREAHQYYWLIMLLQGCFSFVHKVISCHLVSCVSLEKRVGRREEDLHLYPLVAGVTLVISGVSYGLESNLSSRSVIL